MRTRRVLPAIGALLALLTLNGTTVTATEHLKQVQPLPPRPLEQRPKPLQPLPLPPGTKPLTARECERLGGELIEDRNCPEVRDPEHPSGKSRKRCIMRKQAGTLCIDESSVD